MAVALCLPALWTGIHADDYVHRAQLLGLTPFEDAKPIFDLFAFIPGGEASELARELGYLPWWSHRDVRASMFRPVSSATHLLDYRFWPDNFRLQHLHSLVWFGLVVLLVAGIYPQVMGSTAAAGLAGLFFVLEDAHAFPVAWLANRNGLVALAFGVMAIRLHIYWSDRGSRPYLVGALVSLLLGLLSAEAAIAACAYILAYQWVFGRGRLLTRLAALWPYVLVVVSWRLVYSSLGYGAMHSGLYVDPGREPIAFLWALAERAPLLLMSQWFQVPVDLWIFLSRPAQIAMSVLGLVAVSVLVAIFWKLVRESREARFWGLAMVLAVVPIAAAFPMDRLLLFTGIGAFGLLACAVERLGWLAQPAPAEVATGPRRWMALLLILHLVLGAMLLPARVATLPIMFGVFSESSRQAPEGQDVADQTFVFINGLELLVSYIPLMRTVENRPGPKRIALLGTLMVDQEITRLDERTLTIRPDGGFLQHMGERLMASGTERFEVGRLVELPDYRVEVMEVAADGRPAMARFSFVEPLEDASLCFLYWQNGRLGPFPLPAVGETVQVSWASPFAGP